MPLVLARQEGEDFYVGDNRIEVVQIDRPHHFYVRVYNKGQKRTLAVTDDRSVEVLPDVRLSAGTNKTPDANGVKVTIDAPHNVPILRGSLYRSKVGEYAFSHRAVGQLQAIYSGEPDLEKVASMIKESAPCTHPEGNRRFEQLVFKIKHSVVVNVALY